MDQADDFINIEDTLKALTAPRRTEAEQLTSSSKRGANMKTHEKEPKERNTRE